MTRTYKKIALNWFAFPSVLRWAHLCFPGQIGGWIPKSMIFKYFAAVRGNKSQKIIFSLSPVKELNLLLAPPQVIGPVHTEIFHINILHEYWSQLNDHYWAFKRPNRGSKCPPLGPKWRGWSCLMSMSAMLLPDHAVVGPILSSYCCILFVGGWCFSKLRV